MPPRSTPTERQRRLGAELRRLRLAAEASTEFAAGLLGIDRSKVANIEGGVRVITPERVRTLACNYECRDGSYVEALVEMAEDRGQDWWHVYRGQLPAGLLDIAELEWHARRLRLILSVHVPGLLQTDAYARTLFAASLPAMSRSEVELRVAMRMQRQQVLHREHPVLYEAYVHEAALRMQFGGNKVMRAQLEQLNDASEAENVRLQVIPFSVGAFPSAGQSVTYADGAVPQLDTVMLDSAHGPEFTHAQAQLDKYSAHLEWMTSSALPPAESRDLIRSITRSF
ncbi:hypothetical protein DSC45_02645 [Streptomyces sp. YIM 130001]|uniref:helix-turn-helix domain-containing protein n=1 Tax=Streptomyces sp. YIM 130001 TaxID=2259644 RepID=UPI000E64A6A5|nr:helix-turn-helix transcriptional regulator [Streptomyces sp. YIM 130001]RII20719.1 hypothetical protein DSC45_02645 [Streptomyces sp. YIM 130001]